MISHLATCDILETVEDGSKWESKREERRELRVHEKYKHKI